MQKANQQAALTNCRGKRSGLVRAYKKSESVGDTHKLERAQVGTGQM